MGLVTKGQRIRYIDLTRIRRYIKKKYPNVLLGLSTNSGVVTARINNVTVIIDSMGMTQRQLELRVESWILNPNKTSGTTSTQTSAGCH